MSSEEQTVPEIDGVTESEFETAVDEKLDELGGIVSREAAAVMVQKEYEEGRVQNIEDVTASDDYSQLTGVITRIEEKRVFERDDGSEGVVCNLELGDKTDTIHCVAWGDLVNEIHSTYEEGDTVQVEGSPENGYEGLEFTIRNVDPSSANIQLGDHQTGVVPLEDVEPTLSTATVRGLILSISDPTMFERDDGSTGTVCNLLLGGPTGHLRVTLWGEAVDVINNLEIKQAIRIDNGSIQERDGHTELHVNSPTKVEHIAERVDYSPQTTAIESVNPDDTVNLVGGVIDTYEVNEFEKDDGSEGRVQNILIEDETDTILVELWGEAVEKDIRKGDLILLTQVVIDTDFEDNLKASVSWNSAINIGQRGGWDVSEDSETTEGDSGEDEDDAHNPTNIDEYEQANEGSEGELDTDGMDSDSDSGPDSDSGASDDGDSETEIRGIVIGTGTEIEVDTSSGARDVILKDEHDVNLGEEITVRGTEREDGTIEATGIFK